MGQIASIDVVSGKARLDSALLAVGCFEGEAPVVAGLDGAVRGAVGRPGGEDRFQVRRGAAGGQTEAGAEGPVVTLYGLGARRDFTFPRLAAWIGRVSEDARHGGERQVALALPAHAETSGAVAGRILRTLALAPYSFDRFQSDAGSYRPGRAPGRAAPGRGGGRLRDALATAGPVASAVAFARDLANSPANVATPTWMEERCASWRPTAASPSPCSMPGSWRRATWAASWRSAPAPPIRRGWCGCKLGDRGPRIALVGKGITFDTGGISIKPAADMDEMKYDKSGACAVVATARAVAELGLPVQLTVYAPFAENMLSHEAYRPSDIVRCHNGKTVEITNTDAEGRMILADALSWAAEDQPDALVELSTLTGGCVVALGHAAAGLFTTDDGLAGELAAAGSREGERLWRLPLFPEYLEEMKGTHADLRNSAGPLGERQPRPPPSSRSSWAGWSAGLTSTSPASPTSRPTREPRRPAPPGSASPPWSPGCAGWRRRTAPPVSLLTVRGLTLAFPAAGSWQPVVRDLSLTVERGEIFGLVGESGSGKTLTALAILGLLPASARVTAGTIELAAPGDSAGTIDLLTLGPRELRRVRGGRIGLVFQEPADGDEPRLHGRFPDRRGGCRAHRQVSRREARGGGRPSARPGGAGGCPAAAGRLSAPAFGRPAAAGDDRHGARRRPGPVAGGRADDGPRRHPSGPDPGALGGSAAGAGLLRPAHPPTTWEWWRRPATGWR